MPTWNPYYFLLPGKSKHELKAISYSIFYRTDRVVALILCGQGHPHSEPANNSDRRHEKYQLILIKDHIVQLLSTADYRVLLQAAEYFMFHFNIRLMERQDYRRFLFKIK